jgi:hypothetical protein
LRGKGHCVVMDNFFTSVPLFKDLARKGIYTTSTIRSNRIGIPSHLKNTRMWRRCEQGHLEWAIHASRRLSCVMWKDKCPVLLISTHALPIGFPCMRVDKVPRRNGAVREMVLTSPMLLEYTTFMRGVDVADQIWASYSSQSRSHKWWHRIFWAMLDITEVNMYIIYLHACRGRPEEFPTPITHLEFKNALYEALLLGWRRRKEVNNEALIYRPSIHMPSHSTLRRPCVVCGTHLPRTYCY